jgi:hypothetical protein
MLTAVRAEAEDVLPEREPHAAAPGLLSSGDILT